MYVVRRAFRNYNQMITPGSVVEPGSIKRFKSHLKDHDIIEVAEQDFDKWDAYFKAKFGAGINRSTTETEPETEPETVPEDKTPATPVVAVVKPVIK